MGEPNIRPWARARWLRGLINPAEDDATSCSVARAGAKILAKASKEALGTVRTDLDMSMKVALGGALLVIDA